MKTIVWDIDDVLNTLMKDWFEKKWLIENPQSLLTYKDIVQNPPHEILNISLQEYKDSLDVFRLKCGDQLKPVTDVLNWFKQYGSAYRHIALTAVPLALSHISAKWLFTNFGHWIRSFNVVPSPRYSDPLFQYHKTKKEYLEWAAIGDFFIDDSPFNIGEVESLGIKSIMMPQPWNNSSLSIQELLLSLSQK